MAALVTLPLAAAARFGRKAAHAFVVTNIAANAPCRVSKQPTRAPHVPKEGAVRAADTAHRRDVQHKRPSS